MWPPCFGLRCGQRVRALRWVACAMMNQKEKYCQIGDINHPWNARGEERERKQMAR